MTGTVAARRFSLPHALTLGVGLLLLLRVWSIWSQLPMRMASHFGPSGQPNGWMPRGAFILIMLGIGGGTSALFLVMGPLLRRMPPSLINLPNRDYWLAEERRSDAMWRLSQNMAWLGFFTAAFIAFVVELTLEANLANRALDNNLFIAGLGVFLLTMFGHMLALFQAFRVPSA